MKDLFDIIDGFKHRVNWFSQPHKLRSFVKVFAGFCIVLWVVLGFDSGVGMLEELVTSFIPFVTGKISFQTLISNMRFPYGRSFHFSSYIIYGALFFYVSRHFETLGIHQSRNVFYSGFQMVLGVAVFEWIYMSLFQVFQLRNTNLIGWIIKDWWFLNQYFVLLVLGIVGFIAFYIESYGRTERIFKFKLNANLLTFIFPMVGMWLIWIYYPFQVQQFLVNGWTSSILFPQTDYAYFGKVYIENNLLHLINVLTKSFMALTQLLLIRSFKQEYTPLLRCGATNLMEEKPQ